MKTASIIYIVNKGIFNEYLESIKYSLEKIGYKTKITNDIKDNSDVNIITRAFRHVDIDNICGKKIMYQSEELHKDRIESFHRIYKDYEKWDLILEMYEENLTFLKKHGYNTFNVVYCPYGYSPVYEYPDNDIFKPIYDVYFYGSPTKRRIDWFKSLESTGWCKCHDPRNELFSDDMGSKRISRVTGNEYGKDRDISIMKSKIVVNVKAYHNWRYAPLRGLLTQCKKRLYMIEKSNGGYGPYVSGKHFIEFTNQKDFIEKADYWLTHDKEREDFVMYAYNDIKTNCNMVDFIGKYL